MLAAEGVAVDFVGIVDAPAVRAYKQSAVSDGASRAGHRPLRWIGRVWTGISRPRYAFRRFIEEALREHRFGRLAWTWRILSLLQAHRALVTLQETTKWELLAEAVRVPASRHYPGPVSVFRATETWRDRGIAMPDDMHWAQCSGGVRVWHIDGNHYTVFSARNVGRTVQAVLEALSASGASIVTPTT
jgi:thioesterase domain-containing protein